MPDDEAKEHSNPRSRVVGRLLSRGQRASASLVGIVGIATGGTGVFLSDNQAGTTTILLLGAVFLLLGIQGNYLLKAGKDSIELSDPPETAAKRVEEKVNETLETDGPEEAQRVIQGATAARPELALDENLEQISNELFHFTVGNGLARIIHERFQGSLKVIRYESGARGVGVVIKNLSDPQPKSDIPVEIRYTSGSSLDVAAALRSLSKLQRMSPYGLLISNRPPTHQLRSHLLESGIAEKYEVLFWRSEADDIEIIRALDRLLGHEPRDH